jgi:hypothetical protein
VVRDDLPSWEVRSAELRYSVSIGAAPPALQAQLSAGQAIEAGVAQLSGLPLLRLTPGDLWRSCSMLKESTMPRAFPTEFRRDVDGVAGNGEGAVTVGREGHLNIRVNVRAAVRRRRH